MRKTLQSVVFRGIAGDKTCSKVNHTLKETSKWEALIMGPRSG